MNKRKLRAKDSVNTIWWFSKTEWPKRGDILDMYGNALKGLAVSSYREWKQSRLPDQ